MSTDATTPFTSTLCCISLLALGLWTPSRAEPGKVFSICELAGMAGDTNSSVRVRSVYLSDLHHGGVLIDKSCPGVVMRLDWPSEEPRHRSITNFERALYGDVADLSLRQFEIEFVGSVTWDTSPGERRDARGLEKPRGLVRMQRVWTYAKWPT